MPKKFSTENPKAVAARERKKAAKDAETSKKQQQEEDAYWDDSDKLMKKKQQRKSVKQEEQDKKREQQLAKKAEAKALLEKEMSSIKSGKVNPPPKVTRAQINVNVNTPKKESDKKEKVVTHLDEPLEENINRLQVDGEEARSVTEAIGILSSKAEDVDKHPERRMKAAYTAFENKRLNELKIEHPSLRLSQLKQMIFKEWQKSPENPLNKQ